MRILPDAEAGVIRNLMERIDELEETVLKLGEDIKILSGGRNLPEEYRGESQSLKDKEIIEFLGNE